MKNRQNTAGSGGYSSKKESADGQETASQKRRRLIQGAAAGAAVSMAGCLGLFETEEDGEPDNFVDDDEAGDTAEVFSVEFLRAGETLEISSDETVFDAGQAAGISFTDESSCTVGSCGRCESHLDGDATEFVVIDGQSALDEDDNAEGAFLPCVSRPKEDFAVDERPEQDGDVLSE